MSYLFISVSLVACSMKGTLVSNIDIIIYHKILSKLDLGPKQKTILKQDIKDFLNLQRPRVDEMTRLIKSIDLTKKETIAPQYLKLIEVYRELAIGMSKIIIKPMSEFDAGQVKAFLKELEGDNRKLEEKIKEDDTSEYYKRFEFFFGTINSRQKKVMNEYKLIFKQQSHQRLQSKRVLLAEMKEIYSPSTPLPTRKHLLDDAFVKYNQSIFINSEKIVLAIMSLTIECDSDQIHHFQKKKDELIEILNLFARSNY